VNFIFYVTRVIVVLRNSSIIALRNNVVVRITYLSMITVSE